jgi:GNAT superfamily N-acetyltransferase
MTADPPGQLGDTPALTATELPPRDHHLVIPLLLLAEPSLPALRWSLANLSDAVYRFDLDGALVGAATMRWSGAPEEPSELVELAVAAERQGRGVGRQVVAWLVGEARRRGRRAVEVGTRSTSLANIAFYQKCGFRPAEVRRDYFWYYPEPVVEHGIPVRDMLVFRYDLVPERAARRRRAR